MSLIPVKVIRAGGEEDVILVEGTVGINLNWITAGAHSHEYFDKQGYYDGYGDIEPERGRESEK